MTVTFQQVPHVHWGFYQPLNWAWLACVRRKTQSVVWGLMKHREATGENFKQLYSNISHVTYHITVTWTSIQLHYNSVIQLMTLWREEKNNNGVNIN